MIAAIFGALPIAVLIAAFAVPIVYIVYVYDVNLWEDQPIPVTALAFLLTGDDVTAVFDRRPPGGPFVVMVDLLAPLTDAQRDAVGDRAGRARLVVVWQNSARLHDLATGQVDALRWSTSTST